MCTLNAFIFFTKKSLLQANKPDSVTIWRRLPPAVTIIYLGPSSRTGSSCLPPTTFSTEAEKNDRTSRLAIVEVRDFDKAIRGVHGISTHKVYPRSLLPDPGVRSYRTFSPLPAFAKASAGGIAFCDTFCTPT